MDSEQRLKRILLGRTQGKHFIVFVSITFVIFLVAHGLLYNAASFRPVLGNHFLYSSSASHSITDSLGMKRHSYSSPARVIDSVLFPDHALLFSADEIPRPNEVECVYRSGLGFPARPVLSSDGYDEFRSIVRCPILPGRNFSGVDLRWRGDDDSGSPENQRALNSWDRLVYEALIDGNDDVVVFVKGLNLPAKKKADPSTFRCLFRPRKVRHRNEWSLFVLSAPAIAAAQEVVRCALPRSIRQNPQMARGIGVTISVKARETLPSVARFRGPEPKKAKKIKHELCACTMMRNQASALKEWITYHAWLGVRKWFVYDNDSDDGIESVVRDLDARGYNVSRRVWPWIKAQEAGFSHCALSAKDECEWVGFFDVDEFFYLRSASRNALAKLVGNFTGSKSIGEIRTTCRSFGPSKLTSPPPKGVTVGYTCRLRGPERHKSIVRPDSLDFTLLNVVHHFTLKEGFRYLNVPQSTALINHYKYQVWESFKSKFYRRVSTYVVDWQEDKNKDSKDRVPGLGTEAIEPTNWSLKFCEVWDNGLRNFVLANFGDPVTGLLPWEEMSQAQL